MTGLGFLKSRGQYNSQLQSRGKQNNFSKLKMLNPMALLKQPLRGLVGNLSDVLDLNGFVTFVVKLITYDLSTINY